MLSAFMYQALCRALARTKVTSAGATPVFGQDPGSMFHHTTSFLYCVPQPHSHFRILRTELVSPATFITVHLESALLDLILSLCL